ncbi:MAG: hypothetical protein COX16_06115 [Deltaproteobacteria bacterium CG23_combo_of_CG06-09_8_20_14_all_51_20]|nr:MAG: hypothetical protein COX16_06115 [Deltaproteobacteria bacterium CG23_combo_of_CG06-09_8_20_14_all_51_20]
MGTKEKLSVTIDRETLEAIDSASRACRISRSRLAQEALKLWLKKSTEELMAKGYEEMATEDKEFSELALQAQKEVLPCPPFRSSFHTLVPESGQIL